ncbi:hypothetical protein GCM10009113_01300 [Marinobacter szutsaonensis]
MPVVVDIDKNPEFNIFNVPPGIVVITDQRCAGNKKLAESKTGLANAWQCLIDEMLC